MEKVNYFLTNQARSFLFKLRHLQHSISSNFQELELNQSKLNFPLTYPIDEEVLWLQVSVENITTVAEGKPLQQLVHEWLHIQKVGEDQVKHRDTETQGSNTTVFSLSMR